MDIFIAHTLPDTCGAFESEVLSSAYIQTVYIGPVRLNSQTAIEMRRSFKEILGNNEFDIWVRNYINFILCLGKR